MIPDTRNTLVLRTDFSDDVAWESVCADIQRPVDSFQAHVEFLSDARYDGLNVEQILSLIPEPYNHSFLFVVDLTAFSNSDRPILVIDLYDEPGRTFRVIPSEMWGVENNLSLANMDFFEFADAVDGEGVFRGFPRH